MRALVALACLSVACTDTTATYSHEPIALSLAGTGGGLSGIGLAGDVTTPFTMLVDSGAPVSTFSDGSTSISVTRGAMTLYASDKTPIPRLQVLDTQLFDSPLGATGLDAATNLGGVLGGDILSRFTVQLGYVPSPTMTLSDYLVLDECNLASSCATQLPVSLQGGNQLIDIGDNIYSYPASYVLLDGCVEPALDPLESDLACRDTGCLSLCDGLAGTALTTCQASCASELRGCDALCSDPTTTDCVDCRADATRYISHGIDVRFVVSTGFPGLALTASAYDRLRGVGAGEALIASQSHVLYLADQAHGQTPLGVAVDSIGIPATALHDAASRSALGLVDVNSYFGACEEMARSRRLRRDPPEQAPKTGEESCLRSPDRYPQDPLLAACADQASPSDVCDDASSSSQTNGYVEIEGTVPVIVVPNTASLLQSINADVRPQSATVEGVIGTELLRRLGFTIDYPANRVIATCADASCRVFPRSGHETSCDAPTGATVFGGTSARAIAGGGCATP